MDLNTSAISNYASLTDVQDAHMKCDFHSSRRCHIQDADNILLYYEFTELKGKGGQGMVMKAVRKRDGQVVAIKVTKNNLHSQKEVLVLSSINHQYIVTLIEVFSNEEYIFMVMEYFDNTLLDRMKILKLEESVILVAQLVDVINYLHFKGIMHSDIKPENVMICSSTDTFGRSSLCIKLVDFGLATKSGNHEKRQRPVGTLYYMAPEVISDEYDEKADMWSLGVMLFQMITKNQLFKSSTERYLLAQILNFDPSVIESVQCSDPGLKSLLKGLLEPNPALRLTAQNALEVKVFGKKVKYLSKYA